MAHCSQSHRSFTHWCMLSHIKNEWSEERKKHRWSIHQVSVKDFQGLNQSILFWWITQMTKGHLKTTFRLTMGSTETNYTWQTTVHQNNNKYINQAISWLRGVKITHLLRWITFRSQLWLGSKNQPYLLIVNNILHHLIIY